MFRKLWLLATILACACLPAIPQTITVQAAPTLVQTCSGTATAATTLTITCTTAPSVGNFVDAFVCVNDGPRAVPTLPTNFKAYPNASSQVAASDPSATFGANLAAGYWIASGTPPTTFTFTTANATAMAGTIEEWSGISTTVPVMYNNTATATSATTVNTPTPPVTLPRSIVQPLAHFCTGTTVTSATASAGYTQDAFPHASDVAAVTQHANSLTSQPTTVASAVTWGAATSYDVAHIVMLNPANFAQNRNVASTGGGTSTPAPGTTPPPGVCGTIPTLTAGVDYATSFTPFCNGVWNVPINPSCALANGCIASWSQTVINNTLANGNQCSGECVIEAGGSDGDVFYATTSDPVVNVNCTSFCPSGAEAAPSTIYLPAKARSGAGCNPTFSFPDNTMQVWQPSGHDIEFAYVAGPSNSCGSGAGGDWQAGDTISGAVGDCGAINGSGLGFFTTSVVVSAAARCFSAGTLRANEIATRVIAHSLSITLTCGGSPGGSTWQYPAISGASTDRCTGGPQFGPPLGGVLWWDETPDVTCSLLGCNDTEYAIFYAWHYYGFIFTDDFGGDTAALGLGAFTTENNAMYTQYGMTPPYASLAGWGSYSPCPNASGTTNICYSMNAHNNGGGEWNIFAGHISSGDVGDPLLHAHWLNECAKRRTC